MEDFSLLMQVSNILKAGIIVVNNQGTVCAINKTAEDVFWRGPDSPLGVFARDLEGDPLLMEALCSGMANPGHFLAVNKSIYKVASFNVRKHKDKSHFIFLFQDTTKLGIDFESRFAQYYSILQSIRKIIDCCDEGILIVGPDLVPIAVNRSWVKITGLPPSNVLGILIDQSMGHMLNSHSASRVAFESKKSYYMIQTTETGKKLEVMATPIMDEEQVNMVVCTLKPLTHFESIEKKLFSPYLLSKDPEADTLRLIKDYFKQEGIITESGKMMDIINTVVRIAPYPSFVLLSGESGTGKEMFARLIHRCSPRSDYPFVPINCAAIPDSLIESEFFGYETGAFTGAALKGKPGLFELADQGTLFLDEVGDFPLTLQGKLLRVLENGEIIRVGGTKLLKTDVRIVSATNQNLQEMVRIGKFREDLYYRLKVIEIKVPPLRERPEDIIPLAIFFLDRFNSLYGQIKRFSMEVLDLLVQYPWPGNVREIRNVIEQLVLTTPEQEILPHHLPAEIQQNDLNTLVEEFSGSSTDFKHKVKLFEQLILKKALQTHKTAEEAANALGIDRSTLFRKLKP
ncbi:MAG: sigma 54-interacting transcriptional regulator [Bacillota bacterium]